MKRAYGNATEVGADLGPRRVEGYTGRGHELAAEVPGVDAVRDFPTAGAMVLAASLEVVQACLLSTTAVGQQPPPRCGRRGPRG